MKNFKDLFSDSTFLIKVFEELLGIIEVALWDNYEVLSLNHSQYILMITATTAYLIIIGVIVIAIIMDIDEPKTQRFYLIIGAILNVCSGILLILAYVDHESYARTTGSIVVAVSQLVKGILLGVDCYLTST